MSSALLRLRDQINNNQDINMFNNNNPLPSMNNNITNELNSSSLSNNYSKKMRKSKKKKSNKNLLRYMGRDDLINSSDDDDDEKEAWKIPVDLNKKDQVINLDKIIESIKEENIVWNHSKTKLGKESDKNFLTWLTVYSKYQCDDKRKMDDKIFTDNNNDNDLLISSTNA